VHSLKDLPTELLGPFEIAAITERVDPRDAFLSIRFNSLRELPREARVGTSSLRRQAQLKQVRPDLQIFPLRGNVDTRVRKLEEGVYDAVILAAAGLKRLGKTEHIKEILEPGVMCSAAGQGALGIEIRRGDETTREHLAFLNHEPTRLAALCERMLLQQLGGGCQVPIGAFAVADGGEITLTAICARPDGTELIRENGTGADPIELGARIGKRILERGGDKILQDVYNENAAGTPAGA
jgi:hydroxymethylbilane synthase